MKLVKDTDSKILNKNNTEKQIIMKDDNKNKNDIIRYTDNKKIKIM